MARELWYADGYLLTNTNIRDISYESSIFDTPAKRGDNSTIAQSHGELWRPKVYEAGNFTLNMWTFDRTSQAVAVDLYRDLMRVVHRNLELVTFERKWDNDTRWYRCKGEVLQTVSPSYNSNRGYRFGIEVHVPGAFWESPSLVTHSTLTSAALPQSLDLVNHADSNAPMDHFRFAVTGPVTNPRVELYKSGVATGQYWQYNGTVATGQTLTVDSATWAVTGAGGLTVNEALLDYTGARYLTVQPRHHTETAPQVRLSGASGGSGTKLTVTGRSKILA